MRIFLLLLCFCSLTGFSQEGKLQMTLYDGIVIAGYVDNGAFLNFTGPNINASHGHAKFILGMLPSLRFKADDGVTKNSFITPNLGFGFTFSYKKWAIQLPIYYNAKTITENGKWHIGLGIGLRLNEFNQ